MLPSAAHSYQLHQRLQRATPIDIISDDKGVIYSDGTRIAADSLQSSFSLKIQAEGMLFYTLYTFREIRGFFQFKTLRQRISSEDDIYELLPCFSFPRQNKSCQRLLFHSNQRNVNKNLIFIAFFITVFRDKELS